MASVEPGEANAIFLHAGTSPARAANDVRRAESRVLPVATLRKEYLEAFAEIVLRIQRSISPGVASGAPAQAVRSKPKKPAANKALPAEPIAMYVAGGAAQLFYTGSRVSEDIDASFSRRILVPDNLEVAYFDADGVARVLYLDRQYNESFALLHEDVHEDSLPIMIDGIDPAIVDVRAFAPVDLAVSKIARFAEHDQDDMRALARAGLIKADEVRERAEQALGNYVGNLTSVETSIRLSCELIQETQTARRSRMRRT